MWIIRDARPLDLDPLYELAKSLNTLNLPADKNVIRELIQISEDSFQLKYGTRKQLLFVLEHYFINQEGKWSSEVLGSSMIIPQHGTHDRPSSYFRIMDRQKYSSILKRHFKHQTLELIFDYDGPTELGGLVLSPQLRGHPLKLGRFLSYARLAFIASPTRRAWFQDEIVAELLPALGPNRDSELWPYLGQRFTGLDYHTADKLSREHIHFIQELFPQAPLYTSLLPERVQNQLGKVGPDSQPAAHLLSRTGFRFDGTIDPFDGGPTYRVKIEECTLINRSIIGSWNLLRSAELMQSDEMSQGKSEHDDISEYGTLLIDQLDQGGGIKLILGHGRVECMDEGELVFCPIDQTDECIDDLQDLLNIHPQALTSFTPFGSTAPKSTSLKILKC